jgi:LysM repeat protein
VTASSRDPELRRRSNSVAAQEDDARGFRPGPSHVAVAIATIITVVVLAALVVPKLTGSGDSSTPYDTDVYEVRSGDTISSVAALHAITNDALQQANGLTSTSSLDPGSPLTIPLPPASGSYPAGLEGDDDLLALRSTFEEWADEYDVPVVLLEADLWQESAWDNDAVSTDGAVGIGQLLPSTTSYINETLLDGADLDPTDPSDNIQLSAAYFQYLLEGSDGSWAEALASYFAGPTSAQNSAWDSATVAYVTKGMGYLADFQD